MPFPMSFEESINVSEKNLEANVVLEAIHSELKSHNPKSINLEHMTIGFKGGMFRLVNNLNLLVPISSGEICVSECNNKTINVKYFCECSELFWFVNIAILLIFSFSMSMLVSSSKFASESPLLLLLCGICWFWLFGMNFYIAKFRFYRMIKSILNRLEEAYEEK